MFKLFVRAPLCLQVFKNVCNYDFLNSLKRWLKCWKKPVRALISFIKVSLFIIIILFCHLWYIIIHSVAPSLILFSPQDRHTLLLKIYQFLPSNFWTTFLLNFFLLLFSCLQFTFCSTLCSEKSLPNWSIPPNPFLLKINI